MNILLWLDPGAGSVAGQTVQGHIVQAERTASALRQVGLSVDINSSADVDHKQYDLVHVFGVHRGLVRRAREAGLPVVMSPVYWSADYVLGETSRHPSRRQLMTQLSRRLRVTNSVLSRGAGPTAMAIARPLMDRALDFESADLLLPNSRLEAQAISDELGVSTPSHVVPNGVDPESFQLPANESVRDEVLCVARIEPHKNQLGLINAMKRLPYRLTLVGPPHPHHEDYFDACRSAAGPRVTFESAKSHEELRFYYHRARVHVLPSFFETTGLVSLEAALSGCRIATTERGFAREYLLDFADYLNPAEPSSIAKAIEDAWHRPAPSELQARILQRFTWAAVAEATRQGYERVVS